MKRMLKTLDMPELLDFRPFPLADDFLLFCGAGSSSSSIPAFFLRSRSAAAANSRSLRFCSCACRLSSSCCLCISAYASGFSFLKFSSSTLSLSFLASASFIFMRSMALPRSARRFACHSFFSSLSLSDMPNSSVGPSLDSSSASSPAGRAHFMVLTHLSERLSGSVQVFRQRMVSSEKKASSQYCLMSSAQAVFSAMKSMHSEDRVVSVSCSEGVFRQAASSEGGRSGQAVPTSASQGCPARPPGRARSDSRTSSEQADGSRGRGGGPTAARPPGMAAPGGRRGLESRHPREGRAGRSLARAKVA
mmetsp:Transcript_94148/g.280979  ORF Transcript_94148/g.280979 Transcript_94148/m.280979 type:complete len:306 (+) Transcript_94148:172-1089(+)